MKGNNMNKMQELVELLDRQDPDKKAKAVLVHEVVQDLIDRRKVTSRDKAYRYIHKVVQVTYHHKMSPSTIESYDRVVRWLAGRGWIEGRTLTEHIQASKDAGWEYETLVTQRYELRVNGIQSESSETLMLRALANLKGSAARMAVDAEYAVESQRQARLEVLAVVNPMVEKIPAVKNMILGQRKGGG
jgi:hypothetical protein